MSVGSSVSPTNLPTTEPPAGPATSLATGEPAVRAVWAHLDTAVGRLLLTTDGAALTGVWFERHRDGGDDRPSALQRAGAQDADHPVLAAARTQLEEYFARERRVFDLPLASAGTAFQRRVWTALLDIPYGVTASYGDIARRLGLPLTASRAVGLANGSNPISIIVPCHRVIGADGSLTGYGGGLDRKRYLLDLEARPAVLRARALRAAAPRVGVPVEDAVGGQRPQVGQGRGGVRPRRVDAPGLHGRCEPAGDVPGDPVGGCEIAVEGQPGGDDDTAVALLPQGRAHPQPAVPVRARLARDVAVGAGEHRPELAAGVVAAHGEPQHLVAVEKGADPGSASAPHHAEAPPAALAGGGHPVARPCPGAEHGCRHVEGPADPERGDEVRRRSRRRHVHPGPVGVVRARPLRSRRRARTSATGGAPSRTGRRRRPHRRRRTSAS